jgi:hypothetical protein
MERTGSHKVDLSKEEASTWTCSIGMDMQDRHGHAAVTCTCSINMSRRVIYEFSTAFYNFSVFGEGAKKVRGRKG